jgi:hypothetical protein
MLNKKIFVISLLFTLILCGCSTFKRISHENVIIKEIDSTFFQSHYLINLVNDSKDTLLVISRKNELKDSSINYQNIKFLLSTGKKISVFIEKLDGSEGISLNGGYIRAYSIRIDEKIIYEGGKFYNIFKSKNFDGLFYYPDKYK